MRDLVACYLDPRVSTELKRLAVLAGSESNAVERLIEFWNANQSSSEAKQPPPRNEVAKQTASMWRSSTGDELPIGAQLAATYKRRTFSAVVERQGIRFGKTLYQSPSAAGRAVKHSVGVKGSAAQTDGRTFWSVRDPSTGRLVSISELKPRDKIDADELLRELMQSEAPNAA